MVPPPGENPVYYRYLVEFMTFRDRVAYNNLSLFTESQLSAIQPIEIKRWFCLKAYGDPHPGPNDHPTEGRSNALLFCKKALSYYMPHKSANWNEITNSGNPTRSSAVNDLINLVKKKEARGEGKAVDIKKRRPLETTEFEQMLELLEDSDDIMKKYMIPTAAKFQYTMVARTEDITNLKEDDLKPNPEFDFTLLCQMPWSTQNTNNVRTTTDHQILLASMDCRYCILLALGMYLEVWLGSRQGSSNPYIFGYSDDPLYTTNYITGVVSKIWKDGNFVLTGEGPLGSTSLREFPLTKALHSGCSKDEIDHRGRWRKMKKRRVSPPPDQDADLCLPYPDAKVAATLCVGGPIKYVLREGSGVTNSWLQKYVVPNICENVRIPNRVAIVLATPILWACFDNSMENRMPNEMRNKIRRAYAAIRGPTVQDGENPVKKIPIVITALEGQVNIDEIESIGATAGAHNGGVGNGSNDIDVGVFGGGGGGGGPEVRMGGTTDDLIRALYSQVIGLRREVQDLREETNRLSNRNFQQQQVVNRNVRRIALQQPGGLQQHPRQTQQQPSQEVNQSTEVEAAVGAAVVDTAVDAGRADLRDDENLATLTKNPRTLFILWQEHEFGIGGRKPAKLFTPTERGRVKHKYYRRKIVWDLIKEMMREGWTSHTAIDRLYRKYGRTTSVTKIINRIRQDRDTTKPNQNNNAATGK